MSHGAGHAASPGLLVGVLVAVLAAALLGGYVAGARVVRARTGRRWPPRRTAVFAAGVVTVVASLSPPLGAAAPSGAGAHMAQHVLLGMVAPLGMVLGAPLTLALSAAPVALRRRGTAALRARPVRVLAHPVVAGAVHVGGLYALYLTPLYARTVTDPVVHALVLVHLLLAGCLFTWSLVGPERAARPPGVAVRLAVLVAASAAHGYLAKLLHLRAGELAPGGPHGPAELQAAARWMYSAGDVVEVALAVALLTAWYRRGHRRPRVPRPHPAAG